jgi:hypothetical protein
VLNAHVFQLDGIHEVVQRDVRVASAQARQQRSHQTGKGHDRIAAERTEKQIEPHHIGLEPPQGAQQSVRAGGIVKRPGAHHVKTLGLGMVGREVIAQNSKVEKWIALQLLRNVKPIFAQAPGAGRKSRDQTDLH